MAELNGKHIIRSLQKRWIATTIFSGFLSALGISISIFAAVHAITGLSAWWSIPFFLIIFLFLLIIQRSWKISETDVSQFLDQTFPQLEESCSLLLKPYESLNLLEKLQVKRTEDALMNTPKPEQLNRKLIRAAGILLASGIFYFILNAISWPSNQNPSSAHPSSVTAPVLIPEKLLPQISGLAIKIKPPAYTAKAEREQGVFNLEVEEGSAIDWRIKTTIPVAAVQFIFNDTLSLPLHALDNSHTQWAAGRLITSPGFYQVKIGDTLSELYKIEMIRDQPPVIHIQAPKQYTTIDFGEPREVQASVDLSDDYGINDAYIMATIANGSGEAVKFKEQKIAFPGFRAGDRKYQLQKIFELAGMGMKPGDELYFYVNATDNHRQEARSDVYIISIPDTAQLMSLEGLTLGISLKPEYFRSERQIIIETEQLIGDKSAMNEVAFKNKSNDLGIDQKLLRLRYGKFLGEESESNIPGADEDDQKELSDPKNFGNAATVLDKFTDKHDNAEDASFFEPEIKKQLKATLTEMWNAELQLRTFKPQDALPYEYKALRLLKDLQQRSRAYVAKASFRSAALKPEKRLTGDQSKISQPVMQRDFSQTADPVTVMRSALGILEQLKTRDSITGSDVETIARAARQLNNKAAAEPSVYLASAQAIRKILAALHDGKIADAGDILLAENGMQRVLPIPGQLPAAAKNGTGTTLSRQYFVNLNKADRKP